MPELPAGTVTFLFTDIEGSTRLLNELGDRYAELLAEHHRLMRAAFVPHAGVEVDTQGDAFFVAFTLASDCVAAAAAAQEALADLGVRVRMGIHTGQPLLTETGYVGMDVHQAARVMSAGHGGQVLISDATRALLDGRDELTDLGLHRLKDLTEPQRLWQLGEDEFPPLKTLYQTNLPVQPTPLVGRDAELAQVLGLLEGSRLVTLTGAGGSGKTRLALQAAAELVDDFKDGVWWVSLSALRDPELVESTIAQVLGAKDGLADHLRGKSVLLLLDNFEQLLGTAPLIADLLAAAPDLRVLVTSRERLSIAAEQEYSVPTLVPSEAVALFSARARQLRPDFQVDEATGEVCRRLDFLPLAIELAAARIKVLRPDQILERLGRGLELLTGTSRDTPERHRTLRATIVWSHDLLDEDEQLLFARLAVFAGSFDVEAAEVICEAGLETLAALVDKSLLRGTDGGRFFLLETIREYAAERLEESGERDDLHVRHAQFFAGLAEQGGSAYLTGVSGDRLRRLQPEHDNLRDALAFLFVHGDVGDASRAAAALWPLWYQLGYLEDARRFLNRALTGTEELEPSVHAALCAGASLLAREAGDFEGAKSLHERQLALAAELGNEDIRLAGLELLGITLTYIGDFEAAAAPLRECVQAFRSRDDRPGLGIALNDLGLALMELGDSTGAWAAFDEGIALERSWGNSPGLSFVLHSAGSLAARDGDYPRAEELLREALDLFVDLGDRQGIADSIETLGTVAALGGRSERAATLWGTGDAFRRAIGVQMQVSERVMHDEAVGAVVADLGEEEFRAASLRGAQLGLDRALGFVLNEA